MSCIIGALACGALYITGPLASLPAHAGNGWAYAAYWAVPTLAGPSPGFPGAVYTTSVRTAAYR